MRISFTSLAGLGLLTLTVPTAVNAEQTNGCVTATADRVGLMPTVPVKWYDVNGGPPSNKTSYRSLYVTFHPCGTLFHSYKDEHRVWWKRFFDPKSNDKILTLDWKVSSFEAGDHRVLLNLTKSSMRKGGEGWNTDVGGAQAVAPYFRVDQDTGVIFKVEFKASTKHSISTAGDILKLAGQATDLFALKTVPLITKENSPKFQKAAKFADDAISSFFELNIREATNSDIKLYRGKLEELKIATIPVIIPKADTTIEFDGDEPIQVGVWEVWMSPPLFSFFAKVESADEPLRASALSSGSILNFRISPEATLGANLAANEEIVRLRDALVAAEDDDDLLIKAASLCSAVNASADATGLTLIDSAAASWAYLRTLPISDARRTSADGACDKIVDQYPIDDLD